MVQVSVQKETVGGRYGIELLKIRSGTRTVDAAGEDHHDPDFIWLQPGEYEVIYDCLPFSDGRAWVSPLVVPETAVTVTLHCNISKRLIATVY
jgi:hypothetical protein